MQVSEGPRCLDVTVITKWRILQVDGEEATSTSAVDSAGGKSRIGRVGLSTRIDLNNRNINSLTYHEGYLKTSQCAASEDSDRKAGFRLEILCGWW